MQKQNVIKFFQRLQKNNPKPTTELIYNSTFELLIAVILSAQATDKSVNKITPNLFAAANTPEKMASLGETKIAELIKSIGLYKNKAKFLQQTSQILHQNFNDNVPDDFELLQTLPGVGRKTANVIMNTAFGKPTIAVDTHIFRVANRTGLANGKTPLSVEKNLLKNIPDEFKLNAHHWLILHGRYVCKAQKPLCQNCCVADLCEKNL